MEGEAQEQARLHREAPWQMAHLTCLAPDWAQTAGCLGWVVLPDRASKSRDQPHLHTSSLPTSPCTFTSHLHLHATCLHETWWMPVWNWRGGGWAGMATPAGKEPPRCPGKVGPGPGGVGIC